MCCFVLEMSNCEMYLSAAYPSRPSNEPPINHTCRYCVNFSSARMSGLEGIEGAISYFIEHHEKTGRVSEEMLVKMNDWNSWLCSKTRKRSNGIQLKTLSTGKWFVGTCWRQRSSSICNCSLRLPVATFPSSRNELQQRNDMTQSLSNFHRHPFITDPTAWCSHIERKKTLLYIIIFAFIRTSKYYWKDDDEKKKRELNFSVSCMRQREKGNDNLLIFLFTLMHASKHCASLSLSFALVILVC